MVDAPPGSIQRTRLALGSHTTTVPVAVVHTPAGGDGSIPSSPVPGPVLCGIGDDSVLTSITWVMPLSFSQDVLPMAGGLVWLMMLDAKTRRQVR